MARAQSSDFLQNFRFHVRATLAGGAGNPIGLTRPELGEAGFQSVTIPDVTFEAAEYREGIYKYTKKFAGPATFSDVSLMRGVIATDTQFYDWAMRSTQGEEYRADLEILHFSRADYPTGGGKTENVTLPDTPSRVIKCWECIPIRGKPSADMDATTGEVSMAEMDIALERFEILGGDGNEIPEFVGP